MATRPFSPRNRPLDDAEAVADGAAADAAPPRSPRAGDGLQDRLREGLALALFALAAFLVLALLSHRLDPDTLQAVGGDWVGPVGASCAGALAQGFGLVAWLLPVELVLVGRRLFRGPVTSWLDDVLGVRLAGDLIIAIIVASLCQVVAPEVQVFGASPAGGNVGLLFGELMRGLFSSLGSLLVGLTLIGLILISRNQLSFFEVCERLVEFLHTLRISSAGGLARLAEAWREARRLEARETAEEAAGAASEPRHDRCSDASLIAELSEGAPEVAAAARTETGTPPLSLSVGLRSRRAVGRSTLLEESTATDEGQERAEATPASVPSETGDDPSRGVATDGDDDDEGGAFAALLTEEPSPVAAVRQPAPARPATHPAPARPATPQPTTAQPATPQRAATPAPAQPTTDQPATPQRAATPAPARLAALEPAEEEAAEAGEEEAAEAGPALASVAVAEPSAAERPGPFIVDTKPAQETRPAPKKARPRRSSRFELPSTTLLEEPRADAPTLDRERILARADQLEKTLADYGVEGSVEEVHPGPTVTTYEVSPKAGTKVSKVANLTDDLALGLSCKVRIIAPIPGKNRIGFELPNEVRVPVNLRELVEDERFDKLATKAALPVVLGRDIVGAPYYADLATMPHVIVAGATGSGKSVGLNVMLSSLLFCRPPEDLRLLMVDPKVVELAPFDGIPHLLLPVVTDMKQAATALRWAVDEMERRYQLFASAGTKNIETYNRWVKRVGAGDIPAPKPERVTAIDVHGNEVEVPPAQAGEETASLPEKLPFIVVVVDEFADLMMQQGKDVEASVARLAQKARAAGMHVVLATQRPSVDVITGMIKANFPSRIAYRVAQKVDSRTILDEMGAELLLGRGDMLVKANGSPDTLRVQCPFISEEEVNELTDYLRSQGTPDYQTDILAEPEGEEEGGEGEEKIDARFDEAVQIVADTGRCSTSWLQRKMTIGYNRAAKIVEMMEKRGMVGPPNGSKDREVFVQPI